jgi:hypothetical protein
MVSSDPARSGHRGSPDGRLEVLRRVERVRRQIGLQEAPIHTNGVAAPGRTEAVTFRTKTVAAPGLKVLVCAQFERDYRRAGVGLQRLAERKVQDLQRRAVGDPGGWRRAYDRVENLKAECEVLEVDLAGGPRLLAVDQGDKIVLWRMGDHDITKRANLGRNPDPRGLIRCPSALRSSGEAALLPDR